jgi:uncharacterized protein
MISIGVKGIDEVLEGGAPDKARILFTMEPMADGQAFMITMLMSSLESGKHCCIVSPHASADVFMYDLATITGVDLDPHRDQLSFYSMEDWNRMKTKKQKKGSFQKEFSEHITRHCQENSVDIVFVYFDLIYEWFGLELGVRALEFSDEDSGPTVVAELLNFEGHELITKCSEGKMFDLIVSVQSGYNYIPFFNFFTIEYCSWIEVTRRSIPFILARGNITPYISKIVVTGPAQSGKTTFVANASDHGLSVSGTDMKGVATTVAMDLGRLSWKGFDVMIYGTPGHSRFDPIITQLIRRAMGILLLVDATRPDTLPRARDLLVASHGYTLPLIVVATKSDLPHVMDEEMIRRELGLRAEVPIRFISALQKEDARGVVVSLIDHITLFSFDEEGGRSQMDRPDETG